VEFEEQHVPAGTMSYPPIDDPSFRDGPHVSVYVCVDEACQEQAAEYIRHELGHRGVFRPFGANPDALKVLDDLIP
jgi:hypothetical protein